MALKQTSAPATEPVTVAEAKTHLRIDHADEDTYLGNLITAARRWCEGYQGRAYITQTWKLTLDRFPYGGEAVSVEGAFVDESNAGGVIRLPRPPIIAVTGITYLDANGTSQTLSSSAYRLDDQSEPARLTLAYAQSWPSIRDLTNAVAITYTAGYGAAAAVPQEIKQAILLLVGHLYENREQSVEASLSEIPMGVESLLSMERVF